MEKLKDVYKKIVYWGAGRICKRCLEEYYEITPEFLIDSYSIDRIFNGKSIKHPNEISDWSKYFVVIMVMSKGVQTEIQEYLENRGMQKDKDYCLYHEFFNCERPTIEKGISVISAYMKNHLEMTGAVLLVVPLLEVEGLMKFFFEYMKQRRHKKHIILANLGVVSGERMSEKIGCQVFYMPNIYVGNGVRDDNILKYGKKIENEISENECNWLKELEHRKISDDRERTFFESISIYFYFKCITELIKPAKIIVWGNWNRDSYILGYLANCYRIPCGYMEYGWVPGTYQVDPRGIAGQSEYAVTPQMFEKLKVKDIYDIEEIKRYIIVHRLDNRTYIDTEDDNIALSKIKKNKKTVFFVGMGDSGLGINPKSLYWKRYVSNVVESTEEALFALIKLCKKNNWNLIFKPHPGDSVLGLENYSEDLIFVRNMEIDRLIESADVVVSIASAVDYKVLIYGKPLVQLGITGLVGKNCTYIVTEKEMIEEQICMALEKGMTIKQTKNYNQFLQILLQKYLWDNMSERSLRYGLTVEQDLL